MKLHFVYGRSKYIKVLLPIFVLYPCIVSTTFIHERLERIERRSLVMVTYIYKVRLSKWSKCP